MLKERLHDVSVSEERLRLLLDANERLKTELELKTESDSRQVELRVTRALEADRKRGKEESEARELEVKDLHRLIGEYKRETEWAKGEIGGVREELRQAKTQVERLSEERVRMMEERQA